MNTFYRYLRPVTFDITRHQKSPKATGGVSFAVASYEQLDTGEYDLTVAVAVCPDTLEFNRVVAKRVLDTRVGNKHTIRIRVTGLDAESIGKGLVWASDMNRVDTSENDIYDMYVRHALTEYADAVEYILKSHRSAEFLAKTNLENHMGVGDLYREAQ